jgi:hypothetical protein
MINTASAGCAAAGAIVHQLAADSGDQAAHARRRRHVQPLRPQDAPGGSGGACLPLFLWEEMVGECVFVGSRGMCVELIAMKKRGMSVYVI